MPGRRPSLRQMRSYLARCASASGVCGVVEVGARVGHRLAQEEAIEVVGHVVVVGDGLRVAAARVERAVQARLLGRRRRRAAERADRARGREQPPPGLQARPPSARPVGVGEERLQLEEGPDAALHFYLAGDVGATEPELVGLPEDAAHGRGRLDDQGRARVRGLGGGRRPARTREPGSRHTTRGRSRCRPSNGRAAAARRCTAAGSAAGAIRRRSAWAAVYATRAGARHTRRARFAGPAGHCHCRAARPQRRHMALR